MKKKLLSLALACGMVFSLAACGTPANNESPAPNTESPAIGTETPAADTPTYEPATVRVAYMPNLGSAGSLFVGIEQGYFEEVGLTVETFEFQGGPAEIAAMASGDIDISQIGHGAHKLCIQGEAKIFQMDHTTSLSDVVVGNKAKGIETIEDLKGKTVAVSSGTSSEIILEQALARAGMTMDDINTVEMTVDGMTTAMISGQIDAAASWSPNTVTLQNALGDNYVDLGTNADFLDSAIFPSSYICTPEYAEANHDILVRFAQALDKAHDWRAAHPEEMAKLLAKGLIAIHPILSNVPDFACAMISGAVLSFIMKKAGLSHYIDRATINRISGVALDFLVCSAIATLSVKVFALYFVPMITTIAVIIVLNLITNFYFSWKVFDDDWFERAIASYGLESGVLATGLMLLRVVDPKFETTGRESAAASAALCYPWSLPYVMLMPALAFSLSPMTILGFSVLLLVVFLVVARVFFWHPERKFSDILSGSSSRPVQNEEALR